MRRYSDLGFFDGVASLGNPFGHQITVPDSRAGDEIDAEALKSDWEAVGSYLQAGIDKVHNDTTQRS